MFFTLVPRRNQKKLMNDIRNTTSIKRLQSPLFLLFLFLQVQVQLISGAQFHPIGPTVTFTLKESAMSSSSSSSVLSLDNIPIDNEYSRFLSLSELSPTVICGVECRSMSRIPCGMSSCSALVGYNYDEMKTAPSFVEGNVNFGKEGTAELNIRPGYRWKEREANLDVRFVGATNRLLALARFSSKARNTLLEYVRASYKLSLPFQSMSSLTVSPSFDRTKSEPTLLIAGESKAGRTTAVLDLNWEDPTLAVIHALDERNTIAPEISLANAKIQYRWDVSFDSGSSIKTKVDPTSAIEITWTDVTQNGKWVTDFKLPLEGSTGPLAADIRVRRQFVF